MPEAATRTRPLHLLVLTRCFPYEPGEQFITPEAAHWAVPPTAEHPGRRVTVMPWRAAGEPRDLPGVDVDLTLARAGRGARLLASLKTLVSPVLWRDLGWLARHRRLGTATLKEVLVTTRNALLARDLLIGWTRRHGQLDVVYGYWFGAWTLGALLAKGRGISAVATRVHGYDLHEERHPAGFHALKRQLAPALDALLPVSVSGGRVAVEAFGVPAEVVHHSPLGTAMPVTAARTSAAGHLHLLSIASALQVKRIDRLVDAARVLALARPDLTIHWTHLGGGDLLTELQQRAANPPDNLSVTWTGQVAPERIAEHLAAAPVDLFVNTSESEGVPVSIMEAMAHGVPVVAPDVGAIGEIVPNSGPGGFLLGAEPGPDEIVAALSAWAERCKAPVERDAARRIVADHYDAEANAHQVMELLEGLVRPSQPTSRRNP